MPGYDIDGTDAWAVYSTAKEAVDRARSGEGPSLIQVNTLRWKGHDPNDDAPYRPKEELQTWEKYDPVKISKKTIIDNAILSQEDIDKLNDEIKAEINEAVEWGLAQPLPTFEAYLSDVAGKY